MFPIGDDNSDRTLTPYINYAIMGSTFWSSPCFRGSVETTRLPTRFR